MMIMNKDMILEQKPHGVNVPKLAPGDISPERFQLGLDKKLSDERQFKLKYYSKTLDDTMVLSANGRTQTRESFIPPHSSIILVNNAAYKNRPIGDIVNEGTGIYAFRCTNTKRVVLLTSTLEYKNIKGPYNRPEDSVRGALGVHDTPEFIGELPDSMRIMRDGKFTNLVNYKREYFKWCKDNDKQVYQGLLDGEEIDWETYADLSSKITKEDRDLFAVIVARREAIVNKRRVYVSQEEVVIHEVVECDSDTPGAIQAGENGPYFTKGEEIETYESKRIWIGGNNSKTKVPMSKHCSNWSHDNNRPKEYFEFLSRKIKSKNPEKGSYSIPNGKLFNQYSEHGFLWKAEDESYVWVTGGG